MGDNKNQNEEKMSKEEAGKKGGETTKQEYGEEFYHEIGQMGGSSKREKEDKTRQEKEVNIPQENNSDLWDEEDMAE